MPEAEVAKAGAMEVEDFLERIKVITDRAIAAVRQAMGTHQADLAQLGRQPGFKELEAAQPYIVKAIVEAELLRFAEQAEAI